MNLMQLMERFKAWPEFASNITHWEVLPKREGKYCEFPAYMDTRLADVLKKMGISRLYSHQAQSFEMARSGKDFVVVTPTASGKSLCYNLPVLNTLMTSDPGARALYLFPTKALSADQVDELYSMVEVSGADIKTYTFDGDTPVSARNAIRKAGHIVVTNPDMLHSGILPHHTIWIKLFENLKYIVIDELHHYRGVFGSHLANVLRRLKRLCDFYGSNPQYILCSATIGNPGELAEKIIGRPVEVIDNNGAPAGEKHFILYNPPVINHQLGIRKSSVNETARLAGTFIRNDIQTIAFARSRVRVEILTTYLKEQLSEHKVPIEKVQGYRGGYLPNERRYIERGLRSGEILGVVSTNALELGIDIGGLDVAILCGYPGGIASAWQQAGRAGRKTDLSLAIMVASSAPLDQFMVNNPKYFLGRTPEAGIIDPENLAILVSHLKCALFELPVGEGESFGAAPVPRVMDFLAQEKLVKKSGDKYHYTSDIYPASEVSLRSAAPENFVIMDETDNGRAIGEIDQFSAPELVHPEAIYLHRSQQYQVRRLDWDGKRAYVIPVSVEYFTDAESKATIKVLHADSEEPMSRGITKGIGDVSIARTVVRFKKVRFHTHENLGWGRVSLPEQEMHTASFWVTFPQDLNIVIGVGHERLAGALYGASHILREIVPVWALSDPADIRAYAMVRSPFTDLPTIYIYETVPGGVGFSRRIFDMFDDIVEGAISLVKKCACKDGCPSCVGPALEIGEGGKSAARRVLEALRK
ncbi:MAG: ATP-dependent helicase [candidate division Zixibacteria bacterium RBG_16_53_22]|nr:MAG: ATP-dependent helicase [candidate division Zixibacteria bacterium RBG_16_53_22]